MMNAANNIYPYEREVFIISETNLTILKQLARGLAAQFGRDCEVVIHDLSAEEPDPSIIHIENGHVSGRSLGGGPSAVVLDTIKNRNKDIKDQLAYLTRTENGRILKSSTIFIKDDNNIPRYLFAINYDITNLMAFENTIQSLISCTDNGSRPDNEPQKIPRDVNRLLDELIQQSVDLVGVPVPLMTKDDKIKAINFLNEAGAFLITRSGDKVSKYFGISKYTLYSYVDINK